MKVITVALPKGGSAKTATAAEIIRVLASRGQRVLAIDLDQQGNLTTRMGITADTPLVGTLAQVLDPDEGVSIEDAAEPSPSVTGVDILVGASDLVRVEENPPADLATSLRDMLPAVAERWDWVVIDTPPNVGGLTLAGLAAADHVVISVQAATEAYDQIARLEEVVDKRIARRMKPGLTIDAVVPTMYDGRRLLDQEVLQLLTERFGRKVTPPVRNAVAVRDAYTAGMPVGIYDPSAEVTKDYDTAVTHLLTLIEGA